MLGQSAKPSEPEAQGEATTIPCASIAAISVVLMQEANRAKRLVYYISKALQSAKTQNTELEKLAYALVTASRKLHRYFMA